MWILPRQLHTSAYVQDTKALDVDLETFGQMCERSLMWRSKPSQSQTWLRRWKRVKYIQHLSTRTLKPSHSKSFLKKWIFSQRDSHVSRLVLQADETQQTIRDIYTHISLKEYRPVSQLTLFSKMSRGLLVPKRPLESLYSSMSAEIWKKEVLKQRGEYSQRLKLVRLINEKESLSWATPQAMDFRSDVRKPEERSNRAKKGGCSNLREQVHNWPTPAQRDHWSSRKLTKGENISHTTGIKFGKNLNQVVQENNWPTPTGAEVSGGTRTKQILEGKWGNIQLREAIELNTLHDQEKSNTSGKSQESWGTPALYDYNKRPRSEVNSKQASMARNLGRLKQDGKLNPNWVEQMMGLDVGWTQLPTEWID